MKKAIIISLLLCVIGGVSNGQETTPIKDKWLDIGFGFQGVAYQGFDNLTSFEDLTERFSFKLGYKHWMTKRIGLGFDISYGKMFAKSAGLVIDQRIIDASFLLHYKVIELNKLSIFISSGFSLIDLKPNSGGEKILENASRAALPAQLGVSHIITDHAKVFFQASYKKPISDLPDYLQYTLGFSINLNKGGIFGSNKKNKAQRLRQSKVTINVQGISQQTHSTLRNGESIGNNDSNEVDSINRKETSEIDQNEIPSVSALKKQEESKLKKNQVDIAENTDYQTDSSLDNIETNINNLVSSYGKDKIAQITHVNSSEESNLSGRLKERFVGLLKFSIQGIQLDENSDVVGDSTFMLLNEIAKLMLRDKTFKLRLSGYTDNTGSVNYNLHLSRLRANAVKQYLINKGISDSRLITKASGMSNPIASNETVVGRKKNRRVDLEIMYENLNDLDKGNK